MIIYTAVIYHRHGLNHYGDVSEDGLRSQLADYCREWWGETAIIDHDPPADDADVIEEYFEANQEEYIDSSTVDLPVVLA
jgi:hypothetical protein